MARPSDGDCRPRRRMGVDPAAAIRTGGARVFRLPMLVVLGAVASGGLVVALLLRRSSGPLVLRWYFERAGGGVVKIGQLLATRFDLLPAAYCEELGGLLDDLRPVPPERIRAVIERSLGSPVDELFVDFDDDPIGTASLAQVHAARLRTGEPVVVKVLKPGIRRLVAIDMSFLRMTARVLGWVPRFSDLDVASVAKELCRVASLELDLQREAASLAFFHAAMSKDDLPHYAPVPYRDLCAADVLTMERIVGVTVREILSAVHRGDQAQLDRWAEKGITPQGVARLVFRSVLEQTMRYRMFNSDPHPSNLIVSEGGQLNWVDFGLVGWMDEKQWSLQLRIRQAFVRGQIHRAYRLFVESVEPLPDRDLRGFEAEMKEAIRDYILAAQDQEAPITQRSTGAFLMGTLGALRRHGLPISTSIMQLYRAILIADIVMLRLDPRVDWLAEMDDFLVDFLAEQTASAVRSTAEDTATFASLTAIPFTLLDGIEWLDRRLMFGSPRPTPTPSVTDELVLSVVGFLGLVAGLALLATGLVALGVVEGPATGPLAGAGRSVERDPLVAFVLVAAANVVLHRWSRRFSR